MSAPHIAISVAYPTGTVDAFLRADTCETLGIVRHERIGPALYAMAVREDFDRNRADRVRA